MDYINIDNIFYLYLHKNEQYIDGTFM